MKKPNCPNCGKSEFAYRYVPSIKIITKQINLIDEINADIKNLKEQGYDEKRIKDRTEELKKQEQLLKDMKSGYATEEVILVFCMDCGQIIGTGAKSVEAR
ncbi:MAG: hypothetical protein KGD59_15715 [Candidatus Heimdallarchaeota archaeon]|nr:hypothetical protein [Candidatus Heimdallarchaeota archaeon]MBY8995997.1 hypothetical protein [Candidatus Heimdallarchaeota archaeon]